MDRTDNHGGFSFVGGEHGRNFVTIGKPVFGIGICNLEFIEHGKH